MPKIYLEIYVLPQIKHSLSALSTARLGLPATLEQYRERLSGLTCHKLSINSTTYGFFPLHDMFP